MSATPPVRLGARAARGAALTIGAQGGRILIQTVSVVVLARLLSASDYGLVAEVVAIVGIGEIFRDFGLSAAAIQAKQLSQQQRSNLFWLNTAIGLALATIVFSASGLISAVYGNEEVGVIARVLAVTFIFNGLATQFRAHLNRNLRFVALSTADIVSPAVALLLGILAGLAGWGFWALVVQQIAQVAMQFTLVTIFARWRPGLPRRGADMSSLLRFGGNLAASQLVGYVAGNIDSFVIGVRFGASPLGVYNRGWQLLMTPLSQLRAPTTTVALPVLARLDSEPKRYVDFVVRGQLALGFTLVAGLGFVVGAADPIVSVFLGSKWDGVAPILRFLAIAGIFQTLAYVGYWVYLSRGLTSSLFRYTIVSAVIRISAIFIGANWGIVGVAVAQSIAPAIAWPISLIWLSRSSGLPLRPLVLGALRILLVTSWVAGCSYGTTVLAAGLPEIALLALSLLAALIGYGLILLIVPVLRRDALRIIDTIKMIPGERRSARSATSVPPRGSE